MSFDNNTILSNETITDQFVIVLFIYNIIFILSSGYFQLTIEGEENMDVFIKEVISLKRLSPP